MVGWSTLVLGQVTGLPSVVSTLVMFEISLLKGFFLLLF
jgi:hypothetical protein